MQLGEILRKHDPASTAVLFEDRAHSYGELESLSNRFAQMLLSVGVKAGDAVSYLLGNDPLLIAAYIAGFKTGIVTNPLHDRLTADEIAYIVNHAGSKVVVVGEPYAATLAEALKNISNVRVVCFGNPGVLQNVAVPDLDSFSSETISPGVNPNDVALLLYTSGTTGRPKGVMLTHGNVSSGIAAVADGFHLKPSDRTLCIMSLSHTNALMFSTLPYLLSGASVALCKRFSASNLWDLCEHYEVNSFSASPTILSILLEDATGKTGYPKLEFVKVASAPTSVDLSNQFHARFGQDLLIETYGLTETTSINVMNPLRGPRKPGSIGRPLPPSEIRIVDGQGKELPAGATGEIEIRGPTVMKGYYKDPDATAATIRGGWVRSGDLAKVDDDGYIFIVGRKKETIIRGGENISPLEVEQIIARHPAVREAAAVGIPDRIYGEVVAACVVKRDDVTESELIRHCSEYLASFKVPARIAFVDELPRNPIGKFIRRALLPYFKDESTPIASKRNA
ncbi:AMP-dependent synthetase and ligase [Afipia sp. 1NLS2]|nr:AMP-dependent synthetase and ligase [Afipia sp. 1NLS2]